LKKQLAICAGLLLLGLGTAQLAEAQPIYAGPGFPDPALPPYEIMSIVRSTGLAPVTRPMRRGPYYVLVAVDRVGRQMRVVVDASLGDIVNLRPALAGGPYGPEVARSYGPQPGRPIGPPGGVPPLPDAAGTAGFYGSHPSGEGGAPTPPRSIPSARAMNTPGAAPPPASPPPSAATRVAVAEPALPPPLPRPRPKLALNEAPAGSPPIAAAPPPASAPTAGAPAAGPAPSAPNDATDPAKQIE
jgi:hypothetical protein